MGSSIVESLNILKTLAFIRKQTFNFKNSVCLKCAIQLGIPDAIHSHGKPMSLSQLTSVLPIHASKSSHIYRLMRALVNAGFFVEERVELDLKGYTLTPAGRLLLKDEPFNVRAAVEMVTHDLLLKPWLVLGDWFQNDDPSPFETAHGKTFWQYCAEEPRFQKLFNEVMADDSKLIIKMLVEDCKFVLQGLDSVVDVGGGTGSVARAIVEAFPGLKSCIVLELPQVVGNIVKLQYCVDYQKLEFIQGDMFVEIPKAQAVLLKWILHDWSDEDCIKILKNCKKALPKKEEGGKLIIIDMVMENKAVTDKDTIETQISMDMHMLVLYNGKERSEKEWAMLFHKAGFSGYQVFPLLDPRCLIEVYP